MEELYRGPIPATLTPKEDIVGMMLQYVELGMKISNTLTCLILDKVFMVMGEVDLGLIPEIVPPIIQVILVDHQVFIVKVMIEVGIGLRPANFIHKTMVE